MEIVGILGVFDTPGHYVEKCWELLEYWWTSGTPGLLRSGQASNSCIYQHLLAPPGGGQHHHVQFTAVGGGQATESCIY